MVKNVICLSSVLIAVLAHAAVSDYVRSEIKNYNGYDGVDLVTYVEANDHSSHTGRAWLVKCDLTKGYRIKTRCGDNSGMKSTIGNMAEELLTAGHDVVCGINGDYFSVSDKVATPVGFVLDDGRLAHAGSEAFTSKWQSDWVPGRWYIMQTADGSFYHAVPDQFGDWSGKDRPAKPYDVTVAGKKIRNALETNWCNYPVRNGQIHIIGNCQDRAKYPRVMVGLGKTAEGHDMFAIFLNDGRQPDWSFGVTDVDSAQMMIDEGCTDVGEFDGGGSASMWVPNGVHATGTYPRDSTAHGGYVNKASDGSPRLDATGLFLLAPRPVTNRVQVVSAAGAVNPYETLAEALLQLAPNERLNILGDVEMAESAFPVGCTVSGGTLTRALPLSVPAGVTMVLSNAVIAGNTSASVGASGKLVLDGSVSLTHIETSLWNELELRDVTLTSGLEIDCAGAADKGATFAFSGTRGAAAFSSSALRQIRCASNPSLVVKAVPVTETSCIFQWDTIIDFGETRAKVFNSKVRAKVVVSVDSLHADYASGYGLEMRIVTDEGSYTNFLYQPVTGAGDYVFDTASAASQMMFRNGYDFSYSVSLVDGEGGRVSATSTAGGGFSFGTDQDWFAADLVQELASGGSWTCTDPTNRIFAATEPRDGKVRFVTVMSFTGIIPQRELDAKLAELAATGNFPHGAIALCEEPDGSRCVWQALVRKGDDRVWIPLCGPAALNTRQVITMEVDFSAGAPRIRYLTGSTPLADADGRVWFDGPGTALSAAGLVRLSGEGNIESIAGCAVKRVVALKGTLLYIL